jgi:hypothetical protein
MVLRQHQDTRPAAQKATALPLLCHSPSTSLPSRLVTILDVALRVGFRRTTNYATDSPKQQDAMLAALSRVGTHALHQLVRMLRAATFLRVAASGVRPRGARCLGPIKPSFKPLGGHRLRHSGAARPDGMLLLGRFGCALVPPAGCGGFRRRRRAATAAIARGATTAAAPPHGGGARRRPWSVLLGVSILGRTAWRCRAAPWRSNCLHTTA